MAREFGDGFEECELEINREWRRDTRGKRRIGGVKKRRGFGLVEGEGIMRFNKLTLVEDSESELSERGLNGEFNEVTISEGEVECKECGLVSTSLNEVLVEKTPERKKVIFDYSDEDEEELDLKQKELFPNLGNISVPNRPHVDEDDDEDEGDDDSETEEDDDDEDDTDGEDDEERKEWRRLGDHGNMSKDMVMISISSTSNGREEDSDEEESLDKIFTDSELIIAKYLEERKQQSAEDK